MSAEASTNAPTGELINETFWPTLREILTKDPSGMERLSLECMVCYEPMTMEKNQNPLMSCIVPKSISGHAARILPCGHMIGHDCVIRLIEEGNAVQNCPVCRANISHPSCKHLHHGELMPSEVERFHSPPFTLPSGGSIIHPECWSCDMMAMLSTFWIILVMSIGRTDMSESQGIGFKVMLDGNPLFSTSTREGSPGENIALPDFERDILRVLLARSAAGRGRSWQELEAVGLHFQTFICDIEEERQAFEEDETAEWRAFGRKRVAIWVLRDTLRDMKHNGLSYLRH
ncbi:hypothetical protein FZEAL_6026 [Fusarium zealandicum]|uniref:RING-type domain-containing protein n=1 Tax=Fusarium zealandicum TaxID=1053134 RepID=A0A8H4UJJ1_9HYPO|nr:hypothetical protein FZEAL_6026 [Fusarium zealandicum]